MSQTQDDADLIRSLIADEQVTGSASASEITWLSRMCRVAVRLLSASGAGVSVMTQQGARALTASSDPASEVVEELQFTLGEGPCIDAFASRRPVLVPDLSQQTGRWPMYALSADARGVQAVFAFPLQVGAARLGVLDVYRNHVGLLSASMLDQAFIFAELTTSALIGGQNARLRGSAFVAPQEPAEFDVSNRIELYQAQGMVQVQLGVDVSEAMARLRAHSFAGGRRLGDVAHDIVTRKLVLERDDQ